MPSKRAAGQRQVLIWMDEDFLGEIDQAMRNHGYSDRSKFIRDAVHEKLVSMNITVDYRLAMAPSRAGKGGPKKAPKEKKSPKEKPPA